MGAIALAELQTCAKLLQMQLPWGLGPPCLQPMNKSSIYPAYIHHNECLGAVYLIKCSGHGGHCSPKAANLCITAASVLAIGSGATLIAT